jgi:hypothetical protein
MVLKKWRLGIFFLEFLFFCFIIEGRCSVPAKAGMVNSPPIKGDATRGGGFDETGEV